MGYDEAIEATVTREEARREIAKHDGEGFAQFLQDVGDRATYSDQEALDWLRY